MLLKELYTIHLVSKFSDEMVECQILLLKQSEGNVPKSPTKFGLNLQNALSQTKK